MMRDIVASQSGREVISPQKEDSLLVLLNIMGSQTGCEILDQRD
ncbi:MAG TPA: hypothetical protein VFR94_25830 [Nitrososphaeraceae archaeon]|nr:hypothetical protein [Nitrososphaeraceae archaeon]